MRFFYYYPTHDRPSGGHKQLRLQASLLRELGVETFLLREERFFTRPDSFDDQTFYGVSVETAAFPFERAGECLGPDDVVVLPEAGLCDSLPRCNAWRCRVAVNNQNGFHGVRFGPPRAVARRRIEFAFANAPYVAALCHHFYGLDRSRIFLVPHWIVRPPFVIDPGHEPAALAVSYMPRKMPAIVQRVREAVRRAHPDVPWVEIDGVPEHEVARRLRASRVFFVAQDREGCPLTALEAMTCDAVVAGFPGTANFPHPYATPANGFWVRDRDGTAATAAVGRAIELARSGGESYRQMLDAGHATARRFTREAVLEALRAAVAVIGPRSYAERLGPREALGVRGWLQAARQMYDADRLGLVARLAGRMVGAVKRLGKRPDPAEQPGAAP